MKLKKLENGNVQVIEAGKVVASFDPAATLEITQEGKAVGVFYSNKNAFDFYPTVVEELEVAPDPAAAFSGTVEDLLEALSISFFFEDLGGGGGADTNIFNIDGTLTANRTLTGAGKNLTFSDLNEFRQSIQALLEIVTQNPFNTDFFSSIITNSSSVELKGVNDDEVTEGRLTVAEDSVELIWQGFSKIVNFNATNTNLFLQYLDSFLNRASSLELDGRNAKVKASTGAGVSTITGELLIDALAEVASLDLISPAGTAGIAIKKLGTGALGVSISGVPSFDNDAAAGLAGLNQGDLFQTTGLGLAPLNIAGILLRKQ